MNVCSDVIEFDVTPVFRDLLVVSPSFAAEESSILQFLTGMRGLRLSKLLFVCRKRFGEFLCHLTQRGY